VTELFSFLECLRFVETGMPDFLLKLPTFEVLPESNEFRLRMVDSAERAERADGLPLLMGGRGELRPVAGAELEPP